MIPGGIASLLQPLDVAINKPFKDHLKLNSGRNGWPMHPKRRRPSLGGPEGGFGGDLWMDSGACDLSMPDNKFISGKHCNLSRKNNTIWLEDTSTNGTWLNGVKIGKGQKQRLFHRDEIAVVHQEGKEGARDIVYRYEDIAMLEAEQERLDQTQEMDDPDENTEDYVFEDKDDEEGASRKRKKDEDSDDGRKKKVKSPKDEEEESDDILETLICSICQDILHKCISLQPCMHSFCAACISGWMKHSKRCPQP
nr:E3 ubiquitin-protein ligase CHFR-like [Lytechinus pictus]